MVYLLEQKPQAIEVLNVFLNFVHTHFHSNVKTVRSDNAPEFDSYPCRQFFASKGILHQISCVNRRQQNGFVERKQRHILERVKALRFQACHFNNGELYVDNYTHHKQVTYTCHTK